MSISASYYEALMSWIMLINFLMAKSIAPTTKQQIKVY